MSDTNELYEQFRNNLPNLDTSQFVMLPMSRVEPNEGQLDGLPKNPREIKKKAFEKLKNDIAAFPEMLGWRCLLVYPLDESGERYIIIGGNMRYRALSELKVSDVPCIVIPRDTPVDRLQAYTILDNGDFGKWDWDLLGNEWNEQNLNDWGVNVPTKGDGEKDLSDRIDLEYKIEIDCGDEATQEELFNYLNEQGYKCRLLTL